MTTTKAIALSASTDLATTPAQAVATWGLIPPLGNIEAYISAVHRLPMLSLEEEQSLAHDLQANESLEAARKLVLSHLRVVVSVSRQYLGYGLPHSDLIQEGNIGLMKAVKRFNPEMGVRLVSYALHWIKAEIHEYIIKNWRMVKVATTKGQRKLFFNLRSMKQALLTQSQDLQRDTQSLDDPIALGAPKVQLSTQDVQTVAKKLNVKAEEVREMERRMAGGDVVLDADDDDGEDSYAPIHYLYDERHEPSHLLEKNERDTLATDGVQAALEQLDERSRHIMQERWLKVNDDGSGGMTLHELAAHYGVSAERIRQIEVAAMKKMKTKLSA